MTTKTKATKHIPTNSFDDEAEDGLISCVFNCYDPVYFESWQSIVTADMFYTERHQVVWRVAAELLDTGEPITPVDIKYRIEQTGQTAAFEPMGGLEWIDRIIDLTSTMVAQQMGPHLAKRVRAAYVKRQAERSGKTIYTDLAQANGDLSQKATAAAEKLLGIASLSDDATDYMLTLGADDEGNAQCLNRLYVGQFLHCTALGWLYYTGTHWSAVDAEAKLDRAIVDTLKQRRIKAVATDTEKIVKAAKPSAANVRNCKALFKSIAIENINEFDRDKDALNCANGAVDLRTGVLTPHNPDQRFTYCIPVDYEPEADSTDWETWLYSVLTPECKQKPGTNDKPYRDLLTYVQRAIGYSITGRTNEQVLFFLYGAEGRNGKGTLTQILTHILPKPLSAETSFDTFTKDRGGDNQNFDLAPLKAARMVIASESKRTSLLNSTTVKGITGGDAIYCAHKGRDFFNYTPQFKVWLVSNFKIMADADDSALWARIRVIEFPNSYEGNEDKTLQDRLLQNKAGVLAWAVRGAMDWYKRLESGDYIGLPDLVKDETGKQRNENDSLGAFLESLDQVDRLPGVWLRHTYEEWCKENGYKPFGGRRVGEAMERRNYEYKPFRLDDKEKTLVKGWVKRS